MFLLLLFTICASTFAAREDIRFVASGFTDAEQLQCALKVDSTTDVFRGTELLLLTQDKGGSPFYPAVATFSSSGDSMSITRLGSLEFPVLSTSGTVMDPVMQFGTAINDKKQLVVYNTTSGTKIKEIDISNAGNLGNLAIDMTTHKIYGQYWDGSAEQFVEVDYNNGKVTTIGTINLQMKMSATSAIDYKKKLFYCIASSMGSGNGDLLGIDLATGEEKIRKTLSNSIGNGGLFFDSATDTLKAFCRPYELIDKTNRKTDFSVCSIDPTTGIASVVADDADRLYGMIMGKNAFSAANQLYFMPGASNSLDVYDVGTGKLVKNVPTGTKGNIFAMTNKPKCECCVLAAEEDSKKKVADGRRRLGYDSCKPKDTSSATGSLASFAALLGVTVVVALLLV